MLALILLSYHTCLMNKQQFDSMISARYEQIIALIELEAQEAIKDGCGDRYTVMQGIIKGLEIDLGIH